VATEIAVHFEEDIGYCNINKADNHNDEIIEIHSKTFEDVL